MKAKWVSCLALFSIFVSFAYSHEFRGPQLKLSKETLDNLAKSDKLIEQAIIGSGPAGLSAAIFSARRNIHTVVFQGPNPLGELSEGILVENWPGVEPDTGFNVMKKLEKQAKKFGVHVIEDTIEKVDFSTYPFKLYGQGSQYNALSVIIATGSTPKASGIDGEAQYKMKGGVLYCALCDAQVAKDQDIIVIGNEDVAERVLQLEPYAKSITLLVKSSSLDGNSTAQKKIKEIPKVKILYNQEPQKFIGEENHLKGVQVLDKNSGKVNFMPTKWVFLSMGSVPNTKVFKGQLELDEKGYIKHNPLTHETGIQGIYAAGNVTDSTYKQASTCSGDGIKAAFNATKFISNLDIDKNILEHIKNNLVKPHATSEINILKSEDEFADIFDKNKIVLADFYVPTCSTCQYMNNILSSIAYKYEDKIKFIKIDRVKFDKLSRKYNVEFVPTLMIFVKGKLIVKFDGQINLKEIVSKIKEVAANYS